MFHANESSTVQNHFAFVFAILLCGKTTTFTVWRSLLQPTWSVSKYSMDFTSTAVLPVCFCSWACKFWYQFCTILEYVLLTVCTFLIMMWLLCHASCDFTAYTCSVFKKIVCHSVRMCAFVFFYGSLWSDSNKEWMNEFVAEKVIIQKPQ